MTISASEMTETTQDKTEAEKKRKKLLATLVESVFANEDQVDELSKRMKEMERQAAKTEQEIARLKERSAR